MPQEPVDVLIIGAGASGATLAWSLADTRMNILCLEQGDWMDPTRYPPMGMDWEARQFSDFAQLAPYYDLNARMMGVAGLAGDPAYPPKELPLPPVALGRLGETLGRGFGPVSTALWAMNTGRLPWGTEHHRDCCPPNCRSGGVPVPQPIQPRRRPHEVTQP